MGLDIVFYDSKRADIGYLEISPKLHEAIFSVPYSTSYKELKKIKDYYTTDVWFNSSEVESFVHDLLRIKQFIQLQYQKELEHLIEALEKKEINALHIGGD